ncbi:MAG: endopeptidase La [Bacteroidetes bacterium B1(2017)]|nr:MAG: endopeptidase La [Bacteroidetes bacterium B1(2017)]
MHDRLILSNIINDENESTDFISLLSQEEEDQMNKEKLPESLPILPLRNTILFPGVVMPITVARDKSIQLLKEAYKTKDKLVGVVAQKSADIEEPILEDLYEIGTVASILRMIKMPDGSTMAVIQGKRRFKINEVLQHEPYIKAQILPLDEPDFVEDEETKALAESIKDFSQRIINMSPHMPSEAAQAISKIKSPTFLVNFVASNLNSEIQVKQAILEELPYKSRAQKILEALKRDYQFAEIKAQIESKVRGDLDKQQRDFFLQQQIKAIQEELGGDSPERDIETLLSASKLKKWDAKVSESFAKEVERLRRTNPMAPDYSIQLSYLQLLLDLPWGDYSKDNFDLRRAEKILNEDHFGLEKVKQRILEYLAVLKLKNNMKSPILCLYGPPGVGKTSLGKSIAKAVGRKYARIALGGLSDESEIRGHRRTYIGAMPGRIIQNLKKIKSNNPVFVLDEVDKIGNSFRGDPSSALLEVLDPEQNGTFYDNYVEIEYDLSHVMFIATANSLDTIQPALLDRMEIIEINGYTLEEKVQIAKKYLIPKQKENHGLLPKDFELSEDILKKIIDGYTRESGVRGLEKQIASISRHIAREKVMSKKYVKKIDADMVIQILGADRGEKEIYQGNDVAGVVTGLAWTSVGGEILFVESILSKGKGKLTLTGHLGEVMKESAITALSYLKANCEKLGVDSRVFDQFDLHIHVPAGAVPKDGPSAGVTMLTSLASVFTQRKVRPHLAMTGEITLRGKVLPIGGVKEKILAAKRAGIKDILLCEANRKDILEIKEVYLKDLHFTYVKEMHEVIDFALLPEKIANPLDLSVTEVKASSN